MLLLCFGFSLWIKHLSSWRPFGEPLVFIYTCLNNWAAFIECSECTSSWAVFAFCLSLCGALVCPCVYWCVCVCVCWQIWKSCWCLWSRYSTVWVMLKVRRMWNWCYSLYRSLTSRRPSTSTMLWHYTWTGQVLPFLSQTVHKALRMRSYTINYHINYFNNINILFLYFNCY